MKMRKEKKRMLMTEEMHCTSYCCTTTSSAPATMPKEIDEEGPVEAIPEQEAPMPHEVVLADAKPKMPQLCLYHALMRDYEEHLL
jgi:hypothetical protein